MENSKRFTTSPEIQVFIMTLAYSVKAYEYLRNPFKFPLPMPLHDRVLILGRERSPLT